MEEVSAFSLMRFNMKEGRLSWGTMCSIGLNSQAFAAVANLAEKLSPALKVILSPLSFARWHV